MHRDRHLFTRYIRDIFFNILNFPYNFSLPRKASWKITNVYDFRSLFVICHNNTNTLRRSRSDSDWIDIKIIRARHQEATFFTRYLPLTCCCTWKNANIFTAGECSRQWKRPTIDKFSLVSTKLTVFRLADFSIYFSICQIRATFQKPKRIVM